MEWVERLVAVTGWNAEAGEPDWTDAEGTLGTPLPADFKELRRRFAPWGAFSDHILVLRAQGDQESVLANHQTLLRSVRGNPENRRIFEPYGLLGANEENKGTGLLQWGYSFIEEEYYWLADEAQDPSSWPVVARVDPLEPFQRFDMTASEFLYRVLTEADFSVFSVAGTIPTPYFREF
ncbi:hypothetical protein [Streptomyces sp. NPDC046712]|uniref:hypothetical protein n=1 Tax=Streptomyces sp. NPDC046712 TaxID=3154802 RepID=UPI003402E80E